MRGSIRSDPSIAPGNAARAVRVSVSIGLRFGRWTVAGRVQRDQKNRASVTCRCDCGKRAVVRLDKLATGRSTQCIACARARWHNPRPAPDMRES